MIDEKMCEQQLKEILKNKKYVIVKLVYESYDHQFGWSPGYENVFPWSFQQWAKQIAHAEECKELPKNEKEAIKWGTPQSDEFCSYRIISKKNWKEFRANEKLSRMETAAQKFPAKYKCKYKIGSLRFLRAVRAEIKNLKCKYKSWNSIERRMEEYADNMCYSYWDENDCFKSEYRNLKDVWNYCEIKFPLMVTKYKEILQRKKNKE